MLAAVLLFAEHGDGAGLGERLDHLHAGHDRVAGKVARAVLLGDELPRDDTLVRLQLGHLVEQEEGIPMRQDRLDLGLSERQLHADEPLPETVAAAVGMALGSADRHPLRAGDLLEAEVEAVLEHDHLGLRRRDLRQLGAELGPQLRHLGRAGRVAVARLAAVLLERLAAARQLALRDVAAGVDDEPVQPG